MKIQRAGRWSTPVWETLEKIMMYICRQAADRMEGHFLDPLERLYGVCCNTESCQGAVLRSSLVEELTCKKEVDKEVPSKPLLVVLA